MKTLRALLPVLGPVAIVCVGLACSEWEESVSVPAGVWNRTHSTIEHNSSDSFSRQQTEQRLHQSAMRSRSACLTRQRNLSASLGDGFNTLVRPPFVLAGDCNQTALAACYQEVLAPAVKAMGNDYLADLPDEPVTVIVAANRNSYENVSRTSFGGLKRESFGFYDPASRTIVVNGESGHGTLVHELTHALVHVDFPAMPTWFNEGLASLHEECRFADSAIEGLPNWREHYLRQSLADGTLAPIGALLNGAGLTAAVDGGGDNRMRDYAMARYFCLYLQEKDALARFYRQFRDSVRHDPTGERTVLNVLGADDWPQVDAEYRSWLARNTIRDSSGESAAITLAMRGW